MAISSIPKMMTGVSIDKHGGSEVLQIKHDLLVPQPDDDQILIKTEYSGINFIDTYFRTGLYPAPSFPMTLGREVVGTISAISPTLSTQSGLSMHDKVVSLATGTYADYCIASATHTHRLAPTADSQQACAAFLQGLTALTLIREAYPVQRGDWVLVPAAAGGTGGKLVQLLCAVGARVIGTVSSEAKAQLVRGSCEEVVVVSPGGSYPDDETHPVVSRVMQLTAGRGVAAVFDGVGKATFESSFRCLARKGSLVSFGNASGAVPPVAIMRLAPKNIKLLRPQLHGYIVTREEFEKYTTELFSFIDRGELTIDVHKVYDLEDVARAHEDLEARRTTGKLLLRTGSA